MIKTDGIVAEIFIYITNWEIDTDWDVCLRGLNGNFEMDLMQELFKQFKEEPPNAILREAISKEFSKENETMYTIYAELDYNSGEYGEYGDCLYSAYYWIGRILNIEKHKIADPFEDLREG